MKTLHVVFYNHFYKNLDHLKHLNPKHDAILLAESRDEATHVKHHKKKLVLWVSVLRFYKDYLEKKGFRVIHVALNDPHNTNSLISETKRLVEKENFECITALTPPDHRLKEAFETWAETEKIPLTFYEDPYHIATLGEFKTWAQDKKTLTMEYFYREMRKKTGLLMSNGKPIGGKWNYDHDNRSPLPADITIPKPKMFSPNKHVQDVMNMVEKNFPDHFGSTDNFWWGTSHKQAEDAFLHFVEHHLHFFGDYQDAMKEGEPFVFHSLCSVYLNTGLLDPLWCCEQVAEAYHKKMVPLNAAEGFIRQVIGWREFIRGIYWLKMPSYKKTNYLKANHTLPSFFWDGKTKMNCIKQVVETTEQQAYAHHIQRLMITGNFGLIAGIHPDHINEWYLIVYGDAFEWVQLPNTHGMILFADGGTVASKPYAASGSYINRMSNYCKNCVYNVQEKTGKTACPFNYLYWDFLARNQKQLIANPRLRFAYKNWERFSDTQKHAIQKSAEEFLLSII